VGNVSSSGNISEGILVILTRKEEAAAMISFQNNEKLCIFTLTKPLLNIYLPVKANLHTFTHTSYPSTL